MLPMHNNNMNKELALPTTIYHAMSKRAMEQPSGRNRIDFQIRNHRGSGTYIFGFDTGSG